MSKFCHLHCHTQYSLLDGAANVGGLIGEAKVLGMDAIAITDHGNMFGVPHFVAEAKRQGVKPIIGCEFYVCDDMTGRGDKTRYHQLLLAKNEEGYRHLVKLCSLGYIEGYYYKPRIDKKHIRKYASGLIGTTCCLAAEVPRAILHQGEEAAEQVFLSWLEIFGREHYYIELQRHGIKEQDVCNEVLCKWAKKHDVRMIATNDVHYVRQEDSGAHDVLLCLQTGSDLDDPKRMRFDNDQFFLKSPKQMAELFADVPEAIGNTVALADGIEEISLDRELVLPAFPLPDGFSSQAAYLRDLTLKGAQRLEGSVDAAFKERLEHELKVINKLGLAGYFLIVWDLVRKARALDVLVGPGRGSVAGSLVAYCLGITTINPLVYDLIFERFLNDERFSMADIDLDFEDSGRERLIGYLVEKYGSDHVAQIITFGSMGAKTVIRDVARVLKLPLKRADYLAKLVPDQPGVTLAEAFEQSAELAAFAKDVDGEEGRVLVMSRPLEGCVRHTGVHAAGVIIARDKLIAYLPVCRDKKSSLLLTQYAGEYIEGMGLLKMDILGLKTLSVIRTAIAWVRRRYGVGIDVDKLDLDDAKTFALFQGGDTVGVFQFESEGMRKWLRKLRPTHIEDLIAMNALYRPGPMQFIPNFIDRKHGREEVTYPHKLLEELLRPTSGIMVYQEQIMKAAQLIAGYTLAQADVLRYAMGKKKVKEMAKHRTIFIKKAKEIHGIDEAKAVEIFDMMEKFSGYGFNRSHSVAYGLIAYQTGFLKANYSVEFMAGLLTHSQDNIDKVAFFIQEAKRMGISILGPDVNVSDVYFTPSKHGLRFGLAAIKDVGEAAVRLIIGEREQGGGFKDLYDFTKRMAGERINRKVVERLAMVGAFDCFKPFLHRRQYVYAPEGEDSLIERSMGVAKKGYDARHSGQVSLFASEAGGGYCARPSVRSCTPYTEGERLGMEKEFMGFYVSGHPLDEFKEVLRVFCNTNTQAVFRGGGRKVCVAGVVVGVKRRQNKQGGYYGSFVIEDYKGSLSFQLFRERFGRYEALLKEGNVVCVKGMVQERYGQEGVWQLVVEQVELMDEVVRRYTKGVCISVGVQRVDEGFVERLEGVLKEHSGGCKLEVCVVEEKREVCMLSQDYKVGLGRGFFEALRSLGVSYELRR